MLLTIILPGLAKAQGLENFNNFPETGSAYHDGTFSGQDGSTWTYKQSRGDTAIAAPSPTLGKKRNPTACITSGSIQGGCGTLQFDYKQPFTSTVNLNVFVNGLLVGTVTSSVQGQVVNSGPLNVNVSGPFTLLFKQADSTNSGQVTIDNISWTEFGGGNPDPEPSSYPTGFSASANGLSCEIGFDDATGTQLPSGYLIKISTSSSITAPVDGTPLSDDIDLSDGNGQKNVAYGTEDYIFQGLSAETEYYLAIYPYSNYGSTIDYKTDGTAPSANIITPEIVYEQYFEDGLTPWTSFSVKGAQEWTVDSTNGVAGSKCMKMNGYSGGAVENEDWIISSAIDATLYTDLRIQFYSAKNYTGDDLKVKLSTDYSSGDPSTSTWTDLSSFAHLSTGGWIWTASGFFDPAKDKTANIHLAFIYTSSATAASAWEVDNVVITGNKQVGIKEQDHPFEVNLYPNPCKGQFTLIVSDKERYHITIYSNLGTIVAEKDVNEQISLVNVSSIPAGNYWVNIRNSKTGKSVIKGLSIQK